MRAIFIRASAAAAVLAMASWATTSAAQSNPYEELDDGEDLQIGVTPPVSATPTVTPSATPTAPVTVTPAPSSTPVYVPVYVQPIYVPPTATPRMGDTPRVIEPPQPLVITPDSLREETRPNGAAIVSGLVIFGIPYGASLASYGASKHVGDDNLWIPVAGPWLDLADRGTLPAPRSQREDEITNRALLVADGVFQALGAAAVISAFIFPEVREKHVVETAKPHLRVTPMKLGRASYGVGAVGSF
jgi:hypothetical protein